MKGNGGLNGQEPSEYDDNGEGNNDIPRNWTLWSRVFPEAYRKLSCGANPGVSG